MAKGQMRSGREPKKPKKSAAAAKPKPGAAPVFAPGAPAAGTKKG